MKVLVCGGRDYREREKVFATLDDLNALHRIDTIIHGAAEGADILAGEWARERGVKEWTFPAEWAKYGRSAGPRRNGRMLHEGKPDLVVAFAGGKGTKNMVDKSTKAGLQVVRIDRPTYHDKRV